MISVVVIGLTLYCVAVAQNNPTYNINTLAGKVASLNGTAGLQIRFSAFIEEEADASDMHIPPTGSLRNEPLPHKFPRVPLDECRI